METLVVLAVIVGGVVLIVGWRRRRRELRAALQALESGQLALLKRLATLEQWVTSLEQVVAAGSPGPGAAATPPAPAEPVPPRAAPETGAATAPRAEAPSRVIAPPAQRIAAPPSIPPPPEIPPAPAVPPPAAAAPAQEPPVHAPSPEPLGTILAEGQPPAPEPAPSTAAAEPPPAFSPPAAPPPPQPPSVFERLGNFLRGVDWEQLVGVKLGSIVAGVFILIAVVLFIGYSIEQGWVTAPIRMAMSTVFGLALVVASETRWAQGYRITMQALAAAGIAALFGTFFAAYALWHLIPPLLSFALLALVAATAVLLSIRRSSLVVAVLGLLGGFATPILLSTGENRPFGLFGYLLLLNVGLAWVAHKKRWPILSALSLLFTAAYQGGWAAKFLDRSQLPIAVAVFLVFPLVGFAGIALGLRRSQEGEAASPLARWSAVAGALPPSLLALYVASSAEFAEQWPLVMAFAVIVAAGLAAVAAWQGPEWLHLAGGGTVLAALAGFLGRSFDGSQWPLLGAFAAGFLAVYLGAPLLLARLGRDFRAEGRLGVLVAPLVLATFVVVAHVPSATPLAFLLPLLVLTAACAGYAALRGDGRVHVTAAVIALAAEATWSAYHLAPETLYPALLACAALAAVFLGGPLLAERRGRPLSGAAPGPLVLASLLLLFLPSGMTAASAPIGTLVGITVLAGSFQSALFARATRPGSLLLAVAGVVAGFLVLALWAGESLSSALFPGLLAVAALAAVALAGGLLARVPAGDRPITLQSSSPHLAFTAYLFLMAVAGQRDLALSSSALPWLALVGVLDLGFLAAALLRRRPDLLVTAALGSVLVLLAHEIGLGLEAPAPAIAAGAALAVAAFLLAAYLAARRTGIAPARGLGAAGVAALLALHGGQAVLWTGTLGLRWLPPGALAPAHAFLGLALLALAWVTGQELVALTAALAGVVAAPLLLSSGGSAPEVLWLATPAWLLALAYPLLRGGRGRSERLPFIGAVVASAVYLLVARKALIALGAAPYLGALPVVQALLLAPHLVMLLRMEPPSQRDLGRLALVAAAVLGLLTVAVPLQLDKQWWTIGWGLLGAALAWLWRRIPHRGLLGWSGALLAASFVRLVPFLNVWIFDYHARGQAPVWNWYLYAYALVAAAHFAAARCFAGTEDRLRPGWPRLSTLAATGGALLVFFLVNVEIADFWTAGEPVLRFRFWTGFGPHLSYTVAWAAFAGALLWAYRRWPLRAVHACGLALLAVAFIRLIPLPLLNPSLLADHGRIPVLNWFLFGYGAVAAVHLAAARLLRGNQARLAPRWPRTAPLLAGGGVALLFLLVNVEIADFFAEGPVATVDLTGGYHAHLSYTVAWAAFAVGLVLLFRRGAHRIVIWVAALLLVGAFLRLLPLQDVPPFALYRRGRLPILNGFLLSYALVAAAFFAVARLLARAEERLIRWLSILSTVAGTLLLFFLVNVEIADFWSVAERITFRFSAGLAPDLTYTVSWALFAVALLVAGLILASRGVRVAAIGLLTLTVAKAFFHDLARLSGLYRIASFLGLGASLVVVALLLTRFVIRGRQPRPPPVDPAHPEAS